MTWEAYEDLEYEVRSEYIDGALVMSPSSTRDHQRVARRLAGRIEAVLPDGLEVLEGWAWKPQADEFIPDVIVFDRTDQQRRLTSIPHLVVEILSSDLARDIIRKARKYAAAGLERYWIIDPDGPEIIVHRLVNGILVEEGRHGPGTEVTLDVGPTEVSFDPAELVD